MQMINPLLYPYPTYVPNKIVAACFTAMISISLIAWLIQSCQARFRPPRLSFLILISHLMIFIELIVRAAVHEDLQNSKTIFIIFVSLYAIGQRMIIVANFIFIIDIHHKKSTFSRSIIIIAMLFVITSGLLMAPANMLSFDPMQTDKSFLFRKLSASVLLSVTLLFYPIWYWSKTVKDMTKKAIILTVVSSLLCVVIAVFNTIQSLSQYYAQTNSHEIWFYAFQIVPLISAHSAWSILHPKRTIRSVNIVSSGPSDTTPLLE